MASFRTHRRSYQHSESEQARIEAHARKRQEKETTTAEERRERREARAAGRRLADRLARDPFIEA